MANSPISVLTRLAELKKWQEEQQQKLIQQQIAQRNLLMVEQQRMYEALGLSTDNINQKNNTRNSLPSLRTSYNEIEGVSILEDNSDSEPEPLERNFESDTTNIENDSYVSNSSNNECMDRSNSNESLNTLTSNSKSPNISPTISNIRSKTKITFDDIPIKSPKEDVTNHQIEKHLDFYDEEYSTRNDNDNPKPKRPFLRRGQGLVRFKMNMDDCKLENVPKYKFSKTHIHRLNKNNTTVETRISTAEPSKAAMRNTTQANVGKGLNINHKNKSQTTARSHAIKTNEIKEKVNLVKDCERIAPKINKTENIHLKKNIEDNKSKEYKNKGLTGKQRCNINDNQKVPLFKLHLDANSKQSLNSQNPVTTWANVLDPVKAVQNMPVLNHSICDKIRKEQKEIDDLNIFEILEQKVNNSSFCSTSSLISRLLDTEPLVNPNEEFPLKISPEPSELDRKYIEETDTDESEVRSQMDFESECESINESLHVRFNDHIQEIKSDSSSYESNLESISTSCTSTPNPKERIVYVQTNFADSIHESNDEENDSSRNTSLNEDSTLKDKTIESANLSSIMDSEISATEITELTLKHSLESDFDMDESTKKNILSQSELLKSRLQQLENEIEIFRKENASLTRIKQEHEFEKVKFAKQIREAERKLKEEKELLESYVSEEREKLAKEKTIFEKYVKDLKNNPTKKEREEITSLKEKIAELQQEIKSKDSRFGATQARLRTQIKNMEKDVNTFKTEIETLKEKNKKLLLANNRQRKLSSTKMLQEINTNLTKMAPGDIEIQEVHPRRKIPSNILKQNSVSVGRVISHNVPKKRVNSLPDLEQKNRNESPNKSTESISNDESDSNSELESENEQSSKSSSINNLAETTVNEHPKNVDNKSSYFPNLNLQKSIVPLTEFPNSIPKEITGENFSIESLYQSEFNKSNPRTPNNTSSTDRREIIHDDGRREVWYPNGNIKKISSDGKVIKLIYFNGDVKETRVDEGVIKYFYAETKAWHTTFTNGLELLEFANGQVERRYKDGSCEIRYPDGSICTKNPSNLNLVEEWRYPDGTIVTNSKNGEKIIALPNGQREIHNEEHKRREYPDGTVKLVYPDGSQETRYSTGRVRLKDSLGNLIMDSGASQTSH